MLAQLIGFTNSDVLEPRLLGSRVRNVVSLAIYCSRMVIQFILWRWRLGEKIQSNSGGRVEKFGKWLNTPVNQVQSSAHWIVSLKNSIDPSGLLTLPVHKTPPLSSPPSPSPLFHLFFLFVCPVGNWKETRLVQIKTFQQSQMSWNSIWSPLTTSSVDESSLAWKRLFGRAKKQLMRRSVSHSSPSDFVSISHSLVETLQKPRPVSSSRSEISTAIFHQSKP